MDGSPELAHGTAPSAGWFEQFRTFADALPVIAYLADEDGNLVHQNSVCADFVGLSLDETGGWGWLEAVHPDDVGRAEALWRAAARSGEPYSAELRVRRADGEYRWLANRANPVPAGDGVRGWLGVSLDITDQMQVERELRESEATLDTLQREAPVGFGLIDPELRFVRVNRQLAEVNGAPIEEHVGRSLSEVLPELWPILAPLYRQVLESEEAVIDAEIQGETPAQPGVERTWLASYYPVRAGDAVIGVGTLVRDVTEQRELERSLRDRAGRQSKIAELGALALAPDTGLDDLFDQALSAASEVVGAGLAGVAELAGRSDQVLLRRMRGWGEVPSDAGRVPVEAGGHAAYAFERGELVVMDDIETETRFEPHRLLRERGVRSGVVVPISAHGELWGCLTVHSTRARAFSEADITYLRSIAHLLSAAVERAAIKRERELYFAVLESMQEGVALTRPADEHQEARYLFANRAYERTLGYEPGELVGMPISIAFAAEQPSPVARGILEHGESWSGEIELLTKDGRTRLHTAELTRVEHPDFGLITAHVVNDVTDVRRSEEARARLEEQRRRLLAELVNAQEDERRRIAGDLHDGPLQICNAIQLQLEMLSLDAPEQAGSIETISDELAETTAALRTLLFELRPPALLDRGLEAALTGLRDHAERLSGARIEIVGSLEHQPPVEERTVCYRIAREAILNAIAHSGSDRIEVHLDEAEGEVAIRVVDYGRGFSIREEERDVGHIGLITMRERAEVAGGSCRIESRPGDGTTVDLRIPTATNGSR